MNKKLEDVSVSPLMLAISGEPDDGPAVGEGAEARRALVQLLIDAGARVTTKDNIQGHGVFERLGKEGDSQIREILLSAYPTCAICGATDDEATATSLFLRCAGCHSVFYCGKEHQRLHWKEHKLVCTGPRGGAGGTCELSCELRTSHHEDEHTALHDAAEQQQAQN